MQNEGANEASKKDLRVWWEGVESNSIHKKLLVPNQTDESNLAEEHQIHVHQKVQSLLINDSYCLLLLAPDFFFLIHMRIDVALCLIQLICNALDVKYNFLGLLLLVTAFGFFFK
jgi:hypothetical protein